MDKTNYIIPDWPAPKNVRACITTRSGGASLAPYASNNVGLHVGDNRVAVEANRTALCEGLGLKKSPQWLEQVHGVKVVTAKSDRLVRTADASYSSEIGQACVVMTAVCRFFYVIPRQIVLHRWRFYIVAGVVSPKAFVLKH